MRINGLRVVNDADVRRLYAWRQEGATPTIFSADRFLCRFHLHLNEYFDFCAEEGRPAWRLGRAPAFEQEEPDWQAIEHEWRWPADREPPSGPRRVPVSGRICPT